MLTPRQSKSCPLMRMEILKPNINHVKRNVARKSTSNRPLKNSTNTLVRKIDKTDSVLSYARSQKTCFKSNPVEYVKYKVINSKEDNSLDSVKESPRNSITQSCLSPKSPSPVHLKTHVYLEESEEEDENIEGVFSISQGLVPFLSESNLSPPYLSDSADESLDSLKILNYPINADFSGVIFKDVPYYSNKLSSSNSSDNLDCNKSELVKSNSNIAVDNDVNKSVTTNEGIKLVNNAVPDNNISEDILDIPEKRLGGVSVREDFVICEDRPMKMTVIERRDDFDIGKFDNVTDDINDSVDDVNDETDFPKVVCAVSLDPGSEFDFEDIVPQHVSEENQNAVSNEKPLPKKRKPRKRKASSNLFFGSRSKKKTKRSCKSKLGNSNSNPVKELHSSQELETVVNDELQHSELNVPENSNKVLNVQENSENVLNVKENSDKILIKTEVQYDEVSDNFIDSIEEGHEVIEPTDSTSPNSTVQNISNNSDETVLVNSTLIKSEIVSADEYEESIEAKNSIDSDSPLENSNPKEKPIETKKKNAASGDKKSKKEINEGVLLHVEAAKETEIMRDGKLLKDKKELLKDIESKIEKNLPVEVKDFDIQQSLTEEILLEQALRLAHQRTSPRRRPLLSKSETKAILNCLSNQTRYKTRRSNDKKSAPDNISIEDKMKAELNVSTDNSDSEVKKANPVTSDETIAKPRTVSRKKKATKKVSTSKKKTNTCGEEPTAETKSTSNPEHPSELDEKILAQTFENVLQEFQISSTSGEIFLKEEKQQKGANRRKKSNKKSKNKKKALVQSDSELPESDTYYESAISQDSFHDDNSTSGNEECKNKRIPVIIIKNKKVTIADHKNKKGRQTNNLFSIIKNRESNEISNREEEKNNNKEQLEKSKPEVSSSSGDSLGIHDITDTVLSKSENIPTDSKALEITLNSTVSQKTSDNLENSSDSSKTCIESESQKSGVIEKDLVCDPEQFKDESQNNNKVTPLNTTNSSEPEGTVLKIDSINKSTLTLDKSGSTESSLPKSGIIKTKYNEDIVEVIDMDIVDVDSPKPNAADSNTSQDRIEENSVSNEDSNKSPEIPFLENSNSSFTASNDDLLPPGIGITIINKSEDKSSDLPITSEEKIGFPIPTISEINAKYSSNSKSSFQLHTSPVKSNSSFQPNISSRFTGPPPPLPINVNSGFSLQSSITSITGMQSSSMSGFATSMPQESITPLNSPFYPPFSLAASTSVSPFNNSSYQPSMISVSATTLTSSHLYSGTYLQNTLISTSDVHSYHPPLISSGLSNAIHIPPVLPSPVVQNSPLGIPAISTASIQSPHINMGSNTQFPNYSYPPPGHNADSSLSSFPYPPPSNPPISIESNYPLPPNKTNYPPPPSEPNIPPPPDEPKCPPPPDEPQYPPPPDEPQCPPLPDEPKYPPPPDEPMDPISSDKPTYPSPSKDTSSSELKNDAKPSPVINEVQESNCEKITQSKSTTNSEEKLQEKSLTSSPVPTPEPEKPNIANLPKIADIPLSIAARDPRLRNRGLRLVIDSGVISLYCENKPNTQPQNDSKGIEKTENVHPMEQKSADDSNPRLKDVEEAEVKNLTESDNEFSKKKAKKKEIDEELLYKTPLSDLHDVPERTSYSRTITRKPPRVEPRRDPRIFQRTELPHSHFQRDANAEVPLHHHERPEPHWDYPQEYRQPSGYPSNEDGFIPDPHPPHDMHIPDPRRVECYDQRNEHCANDPRTGYHSRWRHDEFTQENKRAREYLERRPLLDASSDYRPNYRHRETPTEDHMRFQGYSQDSRHQNHAEYRRRDADESAYPRWDYAHKRVEGSFPPEVTELKNSYSSKVPAEDRPKKELWKDENEVRDLIDGPMSSASRPFYRRKHFTNTWKPAHLRDDDGSSSPYSDDLFERRRDLEKRRDDSYNDRNWDRSRNHKCDDEVIKGVDRDSREDRRHHRSSSSRRERSRSPRRDYEMYEKKRSRSPRRGRSRRGSLSPRNSPLESPMSPEPEEILYTAPTKYLPIPQ